MKPVPMKSSAQSPISGEIDEPMIESNPETTPEQKIDLDHFLNLAAAQVRHRVKINEADPSKSKLVRTLQLLEDLIKEQGQTNENSRSATGPTR